MGSVVLRSMHRYPLFQAADHYLKFTGFQNERILQSEIGEVCHRDLEGDPLGFSRREVDLAESPEAFDGRHNRRKQVTDKDMDSFCTPAFAGVGDVYGES